MLRRHSGLALVALALTAGAAAGEYRNAQHHFTLSVPDDWDEVPAADLARINAEAAQRGGGRVEFVAGFRHRNADWGGYPYLLIQPLPNSLRGATYEELERSLGRELGTSMRDAEGAIADIAKNLQVGSAALDRSRNRIVLRLQMDVIGAGRLEALSVGHLGAERVVMVHAYAPERDFPRWLTTFDQINGTFRFDPRHTFTPGSGGGFWRNVGAGAGRGAIIGAGVGLLVGLVALVVRKSGKKPPRRFKDHDDA